MNLSIIGIILGSIGLILSISSMVICAKTSTLSRASQIEDFSQSHQSIGTDYQRQLLSECLSQGLESVQIMPNSLGKLSLFDMDVSLDQRNKGFIMEIAQIVEPSGPKELEKCLDVMKRRISEYREEKEKNSGAA
jgi:hypothetical protein